jgi:[ribosomal protein S18]-alanine N-acetyltransferase
LKTIIDITNNKEKHLICAEMMAKSDPWITLGMDLEACKKAFEGDCKEIYGLYKNDEILGFVILQMCGTFKGYIQTLCVTEVHRGEGLGKYILDFSEKRVREISPNIFICVSSFNSGALKLYKSFGFEEIGELSNFVKEGFNEILLRKTFGPIIPNP